METLLLIGSGEAAYKEYDLRACAARYALVLLHDHPITWQKPYLLDYVQVPLTEHELVVTVARQLARRYRFAGVFTYNEMHVELAAIVAQALRLPHNPVESMRHCRDKLLMRQAWRDANVPSAVSRPVSSLQEAKTTAAEIGYPVVVKPRALAASFGVVRVDSPEQLASAYAAAERAYALFRLETRGVLIEEYLAGPEVSVESVVHHDHVQSIAITRKQTGFAPYFEEIGHVVSPQEPFEVEAEIRAVVSAAHRAIGIERGVTHAELRLTSRGPCMVEIGARPGGDFIPELVLHATGLDLIQAGADLATGKLPSLIPACQRAAAVHFVYPLQDGKVLSVAIDPTAADLPWLARVIWLAAPGDELRLPPRHYLSRVAGIIVTGEHGAECQSRVHMALDLLQMQMAPL